MKNATHGAERPSSTHAARLIAWGTRLLYVGPAFELGPHRTATSAFCVALDGEMKLIGVGGRVAAPEIVRSAYAPAGVQHHLSFRCREIACLYADPLSGDGDRMRAGMASIAGGVDVHHPREDEFIALSAYVARGRCSDPQARDGIESFFRLQTRNCSDPRIAEVISAIRADPSESYRLPDLAARAGLSSSWLRHKFKRATGVPMRRYRIWLRIGAAMREVHRGASFTEAAHAAGFASSAHFSKAYRDMFGMTPSAFAAAVRTA